jgi:hypothetical protein
MMWVALSTSGALYSQTRTPVPNFSGNDKKDSVLDGQNAEEVKGAICRPI